MDNINAAPQGVIGMFCSACGVKQSSAVNFCSSCGNQLGSPVGTQNLNGQMAESHDGIEGQAAEMTGTQMGLGMAWGIYAASIAFMWGLVALQWFGFAFTAYLVIGFVMTRIVMRNLIEWHPIYNTVGNVFSAKVWMFLLWPLRMLILLFQLTTNRVL